jgi:hypothetical protein
MKPRYLISTALIALAALAYAQPTASAGNQLLFTNVNVFDGSSAELKN